MNRIDRLFGILTLMQSRKHVPAIRIAQKFQISIRTVYRDIRSLSESGIPLGFDTGKGYFLVPGYFLPPVRFSDEEANALLLMDSLAGAFSDPSIQRHYSGALNKVRSVLSASQKDRFEKLASSTRYQFPDCLKTEGEFLPQIQKAIVSRQILEIGYRNRLEETSRRLTEPIGLIFYALSWHLIAWCHLRRDYRDFKVSRISGIRETGEAFRISNHRELNEYLEKIPVSY